ncbi:MAG: DUF1343 domain-containing protein [Chloroflexota bacterium]
MTVITGLGVLLRDDFRVLAGRRVGLFTNPSAVDANLLSAVSLFKAAAAQGKFQLVALYAPEHGIDAAAPDGEKIASSTEGSLPVHSLYGETQRPTPEMLNGVDVIVCDIQDIGVRYYTFVWTLSHLLEAAGDHGGVELLILDRPNPLGGVIVEGAPLDPELSSLVGRYSLPIRHGLTLGELAQWLNARWNPTPAALDVIPCEGWTRSMLWDATSLPFVPPSPNMPHPETVWQYPGACLVEGTNLSEGRGTALPFEVAGAPFIDGTALAQHLNGLQLPGVLFRPHSFQPTASKWVGERCGGVQAHITDLGRFRALHTWLSVITTIRTLYPEQFAWLPPGESGIYHFDRLIGSSEVRERIETGQRLNDLYAAWERFSHDFEVDRWSFLLYM